MIGKKIINREIEVKTNTNFDLLPHPHILTEYPDNIFYSDFDSKTYSSTPLVKLCTGQMILLTDCKLRIIDIEKKNVSVELSHEMFSTIVKCSITGRYTSVNNTLILKSGTGEITLQDYLSDNPLIFRTLDDSTIQGIDLYPGIYEEDIFDSNIIEGVDWKALDTDVSLEFNKKGDTTSRSIQCALKEILLSNDKYKYIVYDHGSGEIADFITLYGDGPYMVVSLYHVKKMSGKNYNSTVGDIYEVCGQAVKSITWFTTKGNLIKKIKQRHQAGRCELLKGDYDQMLSELRSNEKIVQGEIVVVQPSVSKTVSMPRKFQEVLAATSTFIKRAGKVNRFRIMGSP